MVWVAIVMMNVRFNGGDQVLDRFNNSTPNTLVSQIAEPTLDHVEPRARGRHEIQMESGMAFKPRFDLGVLVGGVIVYDQMDVELQRGLLIN